MSVKRAYKRLIISIRGVFILIPVCSASGACCQLAPAPVVPAVLYVCGGARACVFSDLVMERFYEQRFPFGDDMSEARYDLIDSILVPTDGSEPSIKAARYAARLAKMVDAKVKIVHVMQVDVPGAKRPVELDSLESVTIQVDDERRIKEKAMDIMARTKKCFTDERVPVETEFFSFGNVAEIIVETAEEEGFDLMVMGNRGLGGLQHLMLGSVAAVSRRAPCPVFIVR